LAGVALAADDTNINANSNTNNRATNLKQKIQERWNQRCDVLESRIELRLTRYNNNKERHLNIYNKMKETMNKFIERLREKGYNVSQLETDLATWQTKIDQFKTDYATYIQKLEATKNYACGESEGKFVQALAESRTALRTVHQDILDIRLYYQQTIRKDLQALRNQKTTTNTNINANENDENEDSEDNNE
jgi:hypothetical protein